MKVIDDRVVNHSALRPNGLRTTGCFPAYRQGRTQRAYTVRTLHAKHEVTRC